MHNGEFYGATTIGERGQIVIPQDARKALNLEKGEKLLVFSNGKEVIMLAKISGFKKLAEHLSEKHKQIKNILKNL